MARRHTPEQVIAKVRQGQKMLNDGHPMIEVVKELQVTEATWYRWLNLYGSEKNAEASKRTKELEKENARLKRLLAEKELASTSSTRWPRENFEPRNPPPCRAHGSGEVWGIGTFRLRDHRPKPVCLPEEDTRYGLRGDTASRRPTRRRGQTSGMGMAESPLVAARPGVGWDGAQQQARTPALARGRPRL